MGGHQQARNYPIRTDVEKRMSRERDLQEIKARRAAITPGPWENWYRDPHAYGGIPLLGWTHARGPFIQKEADATFIAHAPTDIDTLLQMIERQAAEIEHFPRLAYDRDGRTIVLASTLPRLQKLYAVLDHAMQVLRVDIVGASEDEKGMAKSALSLACRAVVEPTEIAAEQAARQGEPHE